MISKTKKIDGNIGLTAYDRLIIYDVPDSSDETLYYMSDKILSGTPILANFSNVDVNQINLMLSFLSGVVYAKQGRTRKFRKFLFLFGGKEEFEDGSLDKFYEDYR